MKKNENVKHTYISRRISTYLGDHQSRAVILNI